LEDEDARFPGLGSLEAGEVLTAAADEADNGGGAEILVIDAPSRTKTEEIRGEGTDCATVIPALGVAGVVTGGPEDIDGVSGELARFFTDLLKSSGILSFGSCPFNESHHFL